MNDQVSSSLEGRERGERLRRLRNLANLSRKFLCEQADININTYIGYEVGRYGGLTKKGAEKILSFLSTKGVYSSVEWLMDGVGTSPHVLTDLLSPEASLLVLSEEQKVSEELALFNTHYKHAIYHQLMDDGMAPLYELGCYVAGIPIAGDAIKNLIGLNCILQTKNKKILVRNLRKGRTENTYTLTSINPITSVKDPVLYDVELVFAAEIIWYRKIFKSIDD